MAYMGELGLAIKWYVSIIYAGLVPIKVKQIKTALKGGFQFTHCLPPHINGRCFSFNISKSRCIECY